MANKKMKKNEKSTKKVMTIKEAEQKLKSNDEVTVSLSSMIDLSKEINNTALFVQAILISLLLILAICTLFIPVMSFVTEMVLSLSLFMMAYNNYNTFKRKGFTVIYTIVGIIVLAVGLVAQAYGI